MDSKNVIAAIALSSAVIVLYSLFFVPEKTAQNQNLIEKEKVEQITDTPELEQKETLVKLTREDALTSLRELVSLLKKPASDAEKKVKHAYSIILPHLNKAIDEKNKNGILNILNKLKEILHNLTDFTQESNVKNFEEKLQKSMEMNAVL